MTRTAGSGPVPEMIAAWARVTPDAVAVVAGDRVLTYGQLLDRAWRVAGAVRRAGAGRDEVVGLACRRGLQGLTGMLGILLAGCAYLYLDPGWPVQRLRHMARECRLPLVLTGRQDVGLGVPRLRIGVAARGAAPPESAAARVRPGDLCYVVYTSGSTGAPKGVAVEHSGAANMVRRLAAAFGVGSGVRMLQFASWAWDAAACEILVTLGSGGTLVLAGDRARHGGEELATLMRDQAVHVATLTPSLLAALPEAGLPNLQTMVAVGEPCPPELVARWAPGRRFLNGYGPSEATVAVSVGRCRPGEQVTIGRPLRGVLVEVVDETGVPVARGEPGELVVGGVGVARGYVTGAADGYEGRGPVVVSGGGFVDAPGGRWYRTGDMVYQRADGHLVYLGRIDGQVKVRGHRIELAEVEQALRRHPQVRACAVAAGGGRLVAFAVPRADTLPAGEVLAQAARWLPDFMLPHEIRVVDALPLNRNGKLDRVALRALAAAPGTAPEPVTPGTAPKPAAPAGDLLADMLALVREALEAEQVGPDDDVFDAGGHSLVAAQLAVAATERFGVPVAALQVYDNPTAARLAALITQLVPRQRVA
jgi:amino acid adenylation domain-containing protein